MKKEILFGKEDFTVSYNNLILVLNKLLETEDLYQFETECNLIWDTLYLQEDIVIDLTDDYLYNVFRVKINNVFDRILLRYGIKSEIKNIDNYLSIFTMLNNVKNNENEKETYSLIINGDYGIEDKLYMLLEDVCDNPIEVIDDIEVSELLLNTLDEFTKNDKSDSNIEMLLRTLRISQEDDKFKNTNLYFKLIRNEENIMLDLKLGLNTINELIKSNLHSYYSNNELKSKEGLLLEICFTYLFYNTDKHFSLNSLVNKEKLYEYFGVVLDNNIISNVINTITVKN